MTSSRSIAQTLLALLCCVAALALAAPAPLAGPDLSTLTFRVGSNVVPPPAVIGFGAGGTIYLGGEFTSIDNQPRPQVARLNLDGTLDATWVPTFGPVTEAAILVAEDPSGNVVATIGVTGGNHALVRYPANTQAGTLVYTADGRVSAMTFDAVGDLYVAIAKGSGSNVAASVVKLSAGTTPDAGFALALTQRTLDCIQTGSNSYVKALQVSGNLLYVGGDFVGASNARVTASIESILRVSTASGDVDTTWNPFAPPAGAASAPPAGGGGSKTLCIFVPANFVSSLLLAPGGTIYIAGSYDRQGRQLLGRFQTAGTGMVDSTWAPKVTVNGGAYINAMALDEAAGHLYVAGGLMRIGVEDRNGLAAISTGVDASAVIGWDPGAAPSTLITVLADRVLVGGGFSLIGGPGGATRNSVAAFAKASVPVPGPRITISPRAVDFGTVVQPTQRSRNVTIGNAGDSPLYIIDISVPGNVTAPQTNDCPLPLPVAATCTMTITLNMVPFEYFDTIINITSSGSGTPQSVGFYSRSIGPAYTFTGSGTFDGTTPVGLTRTKDVTLSNGSADPLQISGFVLVGQAAASYSQTNTCPATLSASASCTITISFTPQVQGALPIVHLLVGANVSGPTLSLSGTGGSATDDSDGDGIPNGVEPLEARNPLVKDNDIFGNARLFAMQQYRDFLSREGDAGGIAAWTNFINGGGGRAAMVEGFFSSGEFQGAVAPVARLYFAFFLRIPDYGGLVFWIGQYRAGVPLATIANAFAGSAEFTSRYGALTNDQFVDLVYQNVLGRAADAGGKTYWLGQINGGMTRGTMMIGFSESAEYATAIRNEVNVTMTYVGMLRRSPDSAGFAFWVNYLDGGQSQQDLINGFLAAPEYRSRFLP